jgi:hypothetical protein
MTNTRRCSRRGADLWVARLATGGGVRAMRDLLLWTIEEWAGALGRALARLEKRLKHARIRRAFLHSAAGDDQLEYERQQLEEGVSRW